MSQQDMVAFNHSHVGEALVLSSGSATHFTTADVVLYIYEQLYSVALAKQRSRHAGWAMIGAICVFFYNVPHVP